MQKDIIKALLAEFKPSYWPSGMSFAGTEIVREGNKITVITGFPCHFQQARLSAEIQDYLSTQLKESVTVELKSEIRSHVIAGQAHALPGIKNVIAVASGKGGVGKSTTAVNLAMALQAEGARVGLCDADIYGPSIPIMLGVNYKPATQDNKFIPVNIAGLVAMSIGYLIDETTPMAWRGPMVSGALIQLLHDTLWGELDYLIVDMPPGTGDIQLTLTQKIPVTAALIVTTPQAVATADAKKAIGLFQKVNVPILGLVENMAVHQCAHCGHESAIFGEGGASALASHYSIPLLGQIPLNAMIRTGSDNGEPIVKTDVNNLGKIYHEIAVVMAARIAAMDVTYQHRFPTIQIKQL